MKKIAIGLFGIHYMKYYKRKKTTINYKDSLDNYKKYIFNSFRNSIHKYDIDVFISSYYTSSNIEKSLLKDYEPKNYIFKQYDIAKHRYVAKNEHVIILSNMILDYEKKNNIKYEFIILTRFDLMFNTEISKLNINKNCINVTCKFIKKSHCKYANDGNSFIMDDNLYVIPNNLLINFANIFKKNIRNVAHFFANDFKIYGLNFLVSGEYKDTTEIPCFTINRNKK